MMEWGGRLCWRMVGKLDDGHTFEQDYLRSVSYLIDAVGEFRLTYG